MRKNFFLFILFALVAIFSSCFNTGVSQAASQLPNLAQYIPTGFVIVDSSTKDYGMFVTSGVRARKDNVLPKPFKTPEKAEVAVGFMVYSDPSLNPQLWTEAQKSAEEESQRPSTQYRHFIGKETIRSGGTIYWYQGKQFNVQGAKDEASVLDTYHATIIKQINNGVLTVKIDEFVGDRDTIRKCFQ